MKETDRTLELRIIRAAAGVVRGEPILTTMHELRTATEELARRHPNGYPPAERREPNATVSWPGAPTTVRAPARCIPGRPETWPADLETLVGAELDQPAHPRIRVNVHAPLGSEPEPDDKYRDRLRAESRHDIGRIHGRVLDIAEHVWDAIAPKGEYPATSASRALALGIITAIFEEVERGRPAEPPVVGSRVRAVRCPHAADVVGRAGVLVRMDQIDSPLPYLVKFDTPSSTHGERVWCEAVARI